MPGLVSVSASKEDKLGNNGMIGGNTQDMHAKATAFKNQAEQFLVSLNQLDRDVQALMEVWYGRGSMAYQNAMGKWNHDAKAIAEDLGQMAQGLHGSAGSLTELDNDLAQVFNGLGG